LLEAGIEPDIVCGTSIGALVGAAYVAGCLPKLRQWAEAATWREIVRLIDVRLSGGGLIDGKEIVEFLRGLGVTNAIETFSKTYAAVATDLATGREIWLQKGAIEQALRASISLPGIFSPTRMDGKWLVDGGLSNPVPVSVCRALGADVIIAVNLNGDLLGRRFRAEQDKASPAVPVDLPNELLGRILTQMPARLREQAAQIAFPLLLHEASAPAYFDVLANSINIMQDQITRSRLAGEPPHVMLVPRLHDIGLMQYHRANEAIQEGLTCVAEALPTLRRHL
jgi:NTE family protein